MPDARRAPRRLGAVTAALLTALAAAPCAAADEWDAMRDRQRAALAADAGRSPGMEGVERACPGEREKRAEEITRDRLARAATALGRSAPGQAPTADESRQRLLAATRDWGPNGATRGELRASM